ncbi:Tumor protein D52 [Heterocephalus glaber]|uniref:Tumor protein D52 n=1 Tax=Heterocephalus glaber TaxID=10181 RepID=G5BIT9_HETGA|nr:Tumor protein D52 [Heterocephalus glaber]
MAPAFIRGALIFTMSITSWFQCESLSLVAQILHLTSVDFLASTTGFWAFQVSVHLNHYQMQVVVLTELSPTEKLGLLRTGPVPEEGEDAAATLSATEALSEEEQDELRRELAKVEEEIQTLSQVLAAKEKHLAEIKRKLGIGSLQVLKQNIAKGWQDIGIQEDL